MNIDFTTKNLDKILYGRSILMYMYEHYHYLDYKRLMEQDKWSIKIKSVDQFNSEFYDKGIKNLNNKIPHGVTGMYEVVCYLSDIGNDLIYRQNMMVVTHELAHMILKVYYPDRKGTLDNDDTYAKKGSVRNFFSTEVHNRWDKGMKKTFSVVSNGNNVQFIGVDIEGITNTRNNNRGF